MKVTVIVQNRHIQRAIAAYEKNGGNNAPDMVIGEVCPLHQAMDEDGLIKVPYRICATFAKCEDGHDVFFEPRLPQVLWTPAGWPTALVNGKQYVFELELEQEGE